jgi:hypothetical protein
LDRDHRRLRVLHGAAGSSGSGVGTRRGAPVSPAARAFLELAERRLAEFGEGVLYAGVATEADR